MTLDFFFQNAWRWKEDLAYNLNLTEKKFKIDTTGFEDNSWREEFERLRTNRLLMGQLRYGRNDLKKSTFHDYTLPIEVYLKDYQETGNIEKLVDIANYCCLEFVHGKHPKRHFRSTEEEQFHTKEK
jgi:hypothetical protein